MTTATEVQITPSAGERIRILRQEHRWTLELAAGKAGVPVEVWAAGEAGGIIGQDHYVAILALLGLTEQTVAFIERAAQKVRR